MLLKAKAGVSPYRITESEDRQAPVYSVYGFSELEQDSAMRNQNSDPAKTKQIRTYNEVDLLHEGDVVVSVVKVKAAIVSKQHEGYLQTLNFVKIEPGENLDSEYLVYLINTDPKIRRQLTADTSNVLMSKTTIRQISELKFENLPDLEKQKLIGHIYMLQQKLMLLYEEKKKLENLRISAMLRSASHVTVRK